MDAPTLQALTTVAGAGILTMVLVEIIKRAWNPSDEASTRWTPLISVAVGVVVVLVAQFGLGLVARADLVQGIVTGLFAGWSASGIYSTLKGVNRTVQAARTGS